MHITHDYLEDTCNTLEHMSNVAHLKNMLFGETQKKNNKIWSPKPFLETDTLLKPQYIFCKATYIATDTPQIPHSGRGTGRRKKI